MGREGEGRKRGGGGGECSRLVEEEEKKKIIGKNKEKGEKSVPQLLAL